MTSCGGSYQKDATKAEALTDSALATDRARQPEVFTDQLDDVPSRRADDSTVGHEALADTSESSVERDVEVGFPDFLEATAHAGGQDQTEVEEVDTVDCVCDDGNPCTADWCDPPSGSCVHYILPDCSDTGLCPDDVPCHIRTYLSQSGHFRYEPDCVSPEPCSLALCHEGECQVHPKCVAGDCQEVSCDELTGECNVHSCQSPDPCHTAWCDPNDWKCKLKEKCPSSDCVVANCQSETAECEEQPVDCDDQEMCTLDLCHPGIGCRHVPGCCAIDADCDDGNPCTEGLCNSDGWCQYTAFGALTCCLVVEDCNDGNPVTDDYCDVESSMCSYPIKSGGCLKNSDCSWLDQNTCVEDLCIDNICHFLPVPNCCFSDSACNDGIDCTNDSCKLDEHQCEYAWECPELVNPCQILACDPATGVLQQKVKVCEDDDPATQDSCHPDTGTCLHLP